VLQGLVATGQAIGNVQTFATGVVTDLSWLIASMQGSEADMIEEKSVRVTNDGSLASSISSLSSTVGGVSAAITTEQGTRPVPIPRWRAASRTCRRR